MANYGELLDSYEPDTDQLYDSFVKYFNYPKMTKIKNSDNLSMYMTKLYCLLNNQCRYIVVIVKEDYHPLKTQKDLSELLWVSLQTRTLKDNHDIPSHNYNPEQKGFLNKKIYRVDVNDKSSTYKSDGLPLTITLIHTKTDTKAEYQSNGNIISALETYQTIITKD